MIRRRAREKCGSAREIWVERDDFMENPPKKFYRLSPGKEVRLRYAYFITCKEVVKDAAGEVDPSGVHLRSRHHAAATRPTAARCRRPSTGCRRPTRWRRRCGSTTTCSPTPPPTPAILPPTSTRPRWR